MRLGSTLHSRPGRPVAPCKRPSLFAIPPTPRATNCHRSMFAPRGPSSTVGSGVVHGTRVPTPVFCRPAIAMIPDGTFPTRTATLERRSELRAISETLARTSAGTGRLVVVEGEAGIGKSTILRAALERAAATGLRSLHATGSELEDMYPYGLAIALFEPLLRDPGLPHELLFRGPAAAAPPLNRSSCGRPGSRRSGSNKAIARPYGYMSSSSLPVACRDRSPVVAARSRAAWRIVDLPIPASPSTTTSRPVPALVRARVSEMARNSNRRSRVPMPVGDVPSGLIAVAG